MALTALNFAPTLASAQEPVHGITKLSGNRSGYLVLVPNTEDAKPSDTSRLVLLATPRGSYVSAMQLPEFGMTLHFTVPSHTTARQVAKAATTATTLGQ